MKPRYFSFLGYHNFRNINISLHCIVYIIFMTFKNIFAKLMPKKLKTKMYNCNAKKRYIYYCIYLNCKVLIRHYRVSYICTV